ncbi:hypothetical protein BDN72DRAFT_589897 [Pluteus cervinus]|uniref:Uncharacterized protein n=1 Tax=Pluteus cervinus TaxID=181527 RepID=A0ACD3AVJ7_9AGAR|nr:hypothetical protein BDN72DRAFT_589897 [Pluteus cervinus]
MDTRYKPLHLVEGMESSSFPAGWQLSVSDDTLQDPSPPQLSTTHDRKRMGWRLLCSTFVIVAFSAGFSVFLLIWIIQIHGIPSIAGKSIIAGVRQTGAFLVDEGTATSADGSERAKLMVLTFSSVTTQLVAATAPLLVMMTAYCTAGAWLAQQERSTNDGMHLPTPAQYGLLVKLSSTAGLVAMYDTAQYLFRQRLERRRESSPAMLPVAFAAVVIIYAITHLISVADLWLHATSSAILRNTTLPIDLPSISDVTDPSSMPISNLYPFGSIFNESLCSIRSNRNGFADAGQPCLVDNPQWASSVPSVTGAGFLISANSTFTGIFNESQPNPGHPLSVITLHDEGDLAVIVPSPSSFDNSLTWTAPTYGMRASCRSLTPNCHVIVNQIPPPSINLYNCSQAGYPYLPSASMIVLSGNVVISTIGSTVVPNLLQYYTNGGAYPDNPHEVQVQLTFPNLGSYASDGAIVTADFIDQSGDPAVAFAACQVEYFNLTIEHDAGSFSVVDGSMESSSRNFSAIRSAPLLMGMVSDQLSLNLQPRVIANSENSSALAALNQELGRLPLALFAGSLITQPPLSLSATRSSLVSRYQTGPVLLYTSLLFLYSIIVLAIFLWASTIKSPLVKARDGTTTTSLELARNMLTDPLTLVGLALQQSLHGVKEGSIVKEPIELFGETAEKDGDFAGNEDGGVRKRAPRLELGVVDHGEKAGLIYGVREWRRDDVKASTANARI